MGAQYLEEEKHEYFTSLPEIDKNWKKKIPAITGLGRHCPCTAEKERSDTDFYISENHLDIKENNI